jgi:hypothetical protein
MNAGVTTMEAHHQSGLQSSRTHAMNATAAGLSVRSLSVVMTIGRLQGGSSTGSTTTYFLSAPNSRAEAGIAVTNGPRKQALAKAQRIAENVDWRHHNARRSESFKYRRARVRLMWGEDPGLAGKVTK